MNVQQMQEYKALRETVERLVVLVNQQQKEIAELKQQRPIMTMGKRNVKQG